MAEHIHMIGIGGVGMSAIATVLLEMGHKVSGSDLKDSETLRLLQQQGARVYVGHAAPHVMGADLVVYSSAIPKTNPEVLAAERQGVPILHRSEMLARLLNKDLGIAVAGAHGKTTITGMIAHILSSLGLDPTVLAGGQMQNECIHARWGQGDYVVAEADESDGSFLRYYPHIAVITSVEADHLENFGGRAGRLVASYRRFIANLKEGGALVICRQAYDVLHDAVEEIKDKVSVIVYGLDQETTHTLGDGVDGEERGYGLDGYQARNIELMGPTARFDVYYNETLLGECRISVPGVYNIENALAAIAVARFAGLEFSQIFRVLTGFHGAHRRFEWVGMGDGILVYDDYAHHPTEIQNTLQAAKVGFGRRLVAIFQPQRYSRTKLLMKEFGRSFKDADLVVITDIYAPPPETPLPGVTAERLAQLIGEDIGEERVMYIGDKQRIPDALQPILQTNDLVITMGAGDVWQVAHAVAERIQQRDVQGM
ncbi:MAG: UDP-N-acetylmuramate--L-alanine ligase [Firmicutes bacterium]|nr:UDP-N-acetylmuramate--L-alanine ligase [Bacillota bacterium]